MNKKLKSQVKAAFDAPAPTRKAEFFQSLNFPRASRLDFILGQIRYIRKRVWIVSSLLVIAALFGLTIFPNDSSLDYLWIVSSVLPFVSLMTVTEIARSTSYNMSELEMSCKYNFAGVVLTRLGILSCFNIMVFGLVMLSFIGEVNFNLFRVGIYLLVPFMLTCSMSLFVFNHLRSREATYICGGISCFVGITNALFSNQCITAFSDEYFSFWNAAFIVLAIWILREVITLIRKAEELQWNLS